MKIKYITLFFLIILNFSCKKEVLEEDVKLSSTGKIDEILVVIDKNLWNQAIGDTIFATLTQPFDILPQDENFFKTSQVSPDNLENILKRHRNILYFNFASDSNYYVIEKDKYATNQLFITINTNEKDFFKVWKKIQNNLIEIFFEEAIMRLQQSYSKYLNNQAINKINETFKIEIKIPSDYNLDVLKDNFAWISKETPKSSQNILIYTIPLENYKEQFNPTFLIKYRDYIGKNFVPGPKDNTYMQTEKMLDPKVEETKISNKNVLILRGLWYIENYFLGGPFVEIAIPDISNNRIICVDAFVYGGKEDKKILLWQVEAIIKTIKI